MKTSPKFAFIRVVRTPSSERFLVQEFDKPDSDIAAIDLHYLDNQVVSATVVILSEDFASEEFARLLVETVDARLLPMACLNDGDLNFTVVQGRVLSQFTNEYQPES